MALTVAAMSPRHSVCPEVVVVVTMRKHGVDAEDRDAKSTAHGYYSMVDKVEEDHEYERGAEEDKTREGEEGGTLGLGEYHWTSEGLCRFLWGQPSPHPVVALLMKAFQRAKGLSPDEVEVAAEGEGGNALVDNKAACKQLGRGRMASP